MQQVDTRQKNMAKAAATQIPEARYSYYRRCQVFRKNGEQCKASAEKGASICHAHAGQQAMAFRRDLERRIVLAEAVAEMRRQGKRDCDMTNLLMDFKGIQVTLAVMAWALIHDRIDCKTAGRLMMELQSVSSCYGCTIREPKTYHGSTQIRLICKIERWREIQTSPLRRGCIHRTKPEPDLPEITKKP